MARVSKLANLIHQNALFRGSFESAFGSGRALPETNATQWNSTLRQLPAVVERDQAKLAELLRSPSHDNLILNKKDLDQLSELVQILLPSAELLPFVGTDLSQGDKMITISCVIPVLLSLHRLLTDKAGNLRHFDTLVRKLEAGK
jgi:hypothetical protein